MKKKINLPDIVLDAFIYGKKIKGVNWPNYLWAIPIKLLDDGFIAKISNSKIDTFLAYNGVDFWCLFEKKIS